MPNESLRVPAWCPICSGPMKGKSTNTWYSWKACILCFIDYIEDREQRWLDGWRPSEKELSRDPEEDSTV